MKTAQTPRHSCLAEPWTNAEVAKVGVDEVVDASGGVMEVTGPLIAANSTLFTELKGIS